MARTRVKLRRSYRLQTTLDLGELVLVARYDASREKACTASLPQAPYDSTTRGIHVHPNSEHLASLAECFLSSAATAADPAVRPASEIKVGLSGDTTVRSKAAGFSGGSRISGRGGLITIFTSGGGYGRGRAPSRNS